MWNDDFDDRHQYDDGEAFDNTIEWAAEFLIHELIDRRSKQLAKLHENDFVALFDMVRKVFREWLSPDHTGEIWYYACHFYWEYRKEEEPTIKRKECDKLLQEWLPEWYEVVRKEEETKKNAKKRKKR